LAAEILEVVRVADVPQVGVDVPVRREVGGAAGEQRTAVAVALRIVRQPGRLDLAVAVLLALRPVVVARRAIRRGEL
jgi:hypothetical protein